MVNIYEFTDYREYLRAWYTDRKRDNSRFSYEMLARKAKFSNRGYVYNLLQGKRRLTKESTAALSGALGLSGREARYFSEIVNFTQARSEETRTACLEQIQFLRKVKEIVALPIGRAHYEYLSRWYHSVVRSLIDIIPVRDDFEVLGARVYPPIDVADVKKSVVLLEKLGLVRKDRNGYYRVTGKSLQADEELSRIARLHYHLECTELAKQSILQAASPQHSVSSMTLGISEKTYEKIFDETVRFRERIMELANSDDAADRVYQYQLLFFPVTVQDKKCQGGKA